MKSYTQGLITGGVFVFAFMVLMGSTYYDNDDLMRKLKSIESDVSSIKSNSDSLNSDNSIKSNTSFTEIAEV